GWTGRWRMNGKNSKKPAVCVFKFCFYARNVIGNKKMNITVFNRNFRIQMHSVGIFQRNFFRERIFLFQTAVGHFPYCIALHSNENIRLVLSDQLVKSFKILIKLINITGNDGNSIRICRRHYGFFIESSVAYQNVQMIKHQEKLYSHDKPEERVFFQKNKSGYDGCQLKKE